MERRRNVSYLEIRRRRRGSGLGGRRAGQARVGGGGGCDKEERGGTAGRVREVRARARVKRVVPARRLAGFISSIFIQHIKQWQTAAVAVGDIIRRGRQEEGTAGK